MRVREETLFLRGATYPGGGRRTTIEGANGTGPRKGPTRRPLAAPFFALLVATVVLGASAAFVGGEAAGRQSPGCWVCLTTWSLAPRALGITNPAVGVYEVEIAIDPEFGLTTAYFELEVHNASGGNVLAGRGPSSCVPSSGSGATSFTLANCGAPIGNWYAVLVFHNGTVGSVYNGPDSWRWTSPTVWLSSSMKIYLVSDSDFGSAGYELYALPSGLIPVDGSCTL